MAGWPFAPVFDGSGWLFVALIVISTLPSWVMCGVTSSDRRASTKVVFTPGADTWLNGIDTPWLIGAVLLSSVVTFGAEMVFTVPLFSSAESRRLSCQRAAGRAEGEAERATRSRRRRPPAG